MLDAATTTAPPASDATTQPIPTYRLTVGTEPAQVVTLADFARMTPGTLIRAIDALAIGESLTHHSDDCGHANVFHTAACTGLDFAIERIEDTAPAEPECDCGECEACEERAEADDFCARESYYGDRGYGAVR